MAIYTSKLSMPLVGMSPDAVLSEVRAALTEDVRVQAVGDEPEHPDEVEAIEHVSVVMRFSAPSSEAAQRIASQLHDAALQRALASVPADDSGRGWTSSVEHAELATE